MKCSRCGGELSEEKAYVYQGKVYHENCLMDAGLSIRECDPWATYVESRTKKLLTDAQQLNEAEKKVYDFVKGKGRATRGEVMKILNLSETELAAQLIPLMHLELVKERSEGDTMYLIPIG